MVKVMLTTTAAKLQGHVAAENIFSRLKGKAQQKEYHDSLLGLMELGEDGGMFIVRYSISKWSSSFLDWAMDGKFPI